MTDVREIDGLVAIVSVIRPGASNGTKKLSFTRRYQGLEPVYYPHPSLESCLRNTFGLVVYEEHILQICEAFAGMSAGRADILRRALVKRKSSVIEELMREFVSCSLARGHRKAKIDEVWDLVIGTPKTERETCRNLGLICGSTIYKLYVHKNTTRNRFRLFY